MKSKFLILLPVLIMVMLFSPLAQAQTSNYADPNGVPQYLWYSQTPSDNSVYRGKIDTLSEVPLGGCAESFLPYYVQRYDESNLVFRLQRTRTNDMDGRIYR